MYSRTYSLCLSEFIFRIPKPSSIPSKRPSFRPFRSANRVSSIAQISTTSSTPFELPKTEREVADLLAKSPSKEERKKLFDSLMAQPNLSSKLPQKTTGPAGVQLIPIGRAKRSTNQTGVDVHGSPFEVLAQTYKEILSVLEKIPSSTVYRQAVQSTVETNLEIVNKYLNAGQAGENSEAVEARVQAAEHELGVKLIENAIEQAEDELDLSLKMIESQAWSELEEKPPASQWEYFPIPPSTSYPKN